MKRRDPLTPFRAMKRAADLLGWDAIAKMVGRKPRTVQDWSDPDTSAQVAIGHALAIDIACTKAGGAPHFHRWYAQQLKEAGVVRRRSVAAIAMSAAKAAKEAGEAQAAAFRALLDDATDTDLMIAEREAAEAAEAFSDHVHEIRAARGVEVGE